MSNNVGSSLVLLVVAIIILWFAVTDRMSRLLDAWDVITGKSTASSSSHQVSNTVAAGNVTFRLPTLPALGHNPQVPAV